MTNNNVIVINGRRYDAITGQLLDPNDQPTNKARSIDGVSIAKKSKSPDDKRPQVLQDQPTHPSQRVGRAHDIILSKAMHSNSPTKPLMRIGLKKPLKTTKPIKKLQTPMGLTQSANSI